MPGACAQGVREAVAVPPGRTRARGIEAGVAAVVSVESMTSRVWHSWMREVAGVEAIVRSAQGRMMTATSALTAMLVVQVDLAGTAGATGQVAQRRRLIPVRSLVLALRN